MDWQAEIAVELGIITESQATEEMQSRLKKFEKSCVDNYSYARESQVDSYPSRILESEHKEIVGSITRENSHDISLLIKSCDALKDTICRKNQYIYDLKKQLERKGV